MWWFCGSSPHRREKPAGWLNAALKYKYLNEKPRKKFLDTGHGIDFFEYDTKSINDKSETIIRLKGF